MRQLLGRRLATARPDEHAGRLAGAAALAAPALEGGQPATGAQAAGIDHGLYWLVADIAEQEPAIVIVDDAHWADVPSLRFPLYLARRVAALPVLLVVATRPLAPDVATREIELLAEEPAANGDPARLPQR